MAEIGAEEDVLKIRNPLTKLIITKAIHKAIKIDFFFIINLSFKNIKLSICFITAYVIFAKVKNKRKW